MRWAFFVEQKTTLHVYLGHVQEIPQGLQTCTSLQESGTSSWLLLYLLDSLLGERHCINKCISFN